MKGSISPKRFQTVRKLLNFPKCEPFNRIFLKFQEQSCLVSTSSIKREIKQFHVVVVQRRQRNGQKSVMHVQSCFFFISTIAFFRRSRRRYRRRCTSSLLLLLPTSPPSEDARQTRWHYTTNIEARYIVRY